MNRATSNKRRNNDYIRGRVSSSSSSSSSRWRRQIGIKILMIMIGFVSLFGFFLVYHLSDVHNNNNDTHDDESISTFKNNGIVKSAPAPRRDRRRYRDRLRHSKRQILLPLTAYIEEPLRIEKPLPIRTKPNLRKITYGTTTTQSSYCHNNNIQDLFPVDHPIELDPIFGPTVGTLLSLYPFREQYATVACPIDADPFLPWIHDVFLNTDRTYVEVIASNKRRCRTDPSLFLDDITNLEPQIAIMQSVSVKRIQSIKMNNDNDNNNSNNNNNNNKETTRSYRYRLASIEEADVDGRETRFICQFHTPKMIRNNNNNNNGDDVIGKKILAETLSIFPYNYEHANYQKGGGRTRNSAKPMLTRPQDSTDRHGSTHNENVWNSILHFKCPVPDFLRNKLIQDNNNTDNDTSNNNNNNNSNNTKNMIYMDLVPIRTPARETTEGYNPQLLALSSFNATEEWGTNHILPSVEDSGRWSNIPLCPVVVPVPSLMGNSSNSSNSSSSSSSSNSTTTTTTTTEVSSHSETDNNSSSSNSSSSAVVKTTTSTSNNTRPHHYLIGCLWTSAEFSTRGDSTIDNSTSVRLLEWIVYHLYIAKMDHIYVYDNTPRAIITNTNTSSSLSSSLKDVVDLFPSDRVTRIPWKHRVCNNNRPMHKNSGERSSQYAAETSCRVRYGPMTEWLAQLDVDEYLIPAGDWTDIQSWLKESVMTGKIEKKTNILSFFQTRAVPNINFMDTCPCNKDDDQDDQQQCLIKRENISFLQTYDCERTVLPKPDFGWRAKKQIYRPNYVLNHFVHYTTVTQRIHDAPNEDLPLYNQRRPYERRVNELEEAFMLHTKTTYPSATRQWTTSCQGQSEEDKKKCPVGIAYSLDSTTEGEEDLQKRNTTHTKAGFAYNCYQHKRIQNELAIKLQAFLQPFLNRFHKY